MPLKILRLDGSKLVIVDLFFYLRFFLLNLLVLIVNGENLLPDTELLLMIGSTRTHSLLQLLSRVRRDVIEVSVLRLLGRRLGWSDLFDEWLQSLLKMIIRLSEVKAHLVLIKETLREQIFVASSNLVDDL